jgi:hypothetical protein
MVFFQDTKLRNEWLWHAACECIRELHRSHAMTSNIRPISTLTSRKEALEAKLDETLNISTLREDLDIEYRPIPSTKCVQGSIATLRSNN